MAATGTPTSATASPATASWPPRCPERTGRALSFAKDPHARRATDSPTLPDVAKGEHTMIEAAGREVRLSNPGKVYFPRPAGRSSTSSRYYLETAEAVLDPPARAPDGDEALRQRDHGGADLAEARAAEHPRLAADGDGRVPVRAHRRGARRQRRRAPRVGGQPRRDRLQPVAGAARRPRRARRAARRPRPDARRRLGRRCAAPRSSCATCSPSTACAATRRRRARRASTSTSGSCPSGTRSASAAPRWRSRARSSGARPTWRRASGGRRSATACSSTTTRTRATAPSPPATRCARRRTRACRARCDWDEVADVEPGDLRLDTVPERLREPRPGRRHRRQRRHARRLLDLARRDEEERARRRAVAAALPQAEGRAQARAAEPRPRPADPARPRRRSAAGRPAARGEPRRAAARLRLEAPHGPGPRARVRR